DNPLRPLDIRVKRIAVPLLDLNIASVPRLDTLAGWIAAAERVGRAREVDTLFLVHLYPRAFAQIHDARRQALGDEGPAQHLTMTAADEDCVAVLDAACFRVDRVHHELLREDSA